MQPPVPTPTIESVRSFEFPSSNEVFVCIMKDINPKLAEESGFEEVTPEEKRLYKADIEEYKRQLQTWVIAVQSVFKEVQHHMRDSKERVEELEQAKHLEQLEQSLQNDEL